MRKILAVVRREFIERVRTKAFIIGTVLGPILFGAMAIIPGLILSRQTTGQRIVVVDGTPSEFGARIEQALARAKLGKAADAKPLYAPTRVTAVGRVQDVVDSLVPLTGLGKKAGPSVDGILIIDEGSVTTGKLRYYGKNVGSLSDMGELRSALNPLMIGERLRAVGVDPQVAMAAAVPVSLDTRKVAEGKLTAESGASTFALAYAMGIVLYMALVLYGTQVMTSVIEEKANRIVEVLVSSLTPFQMMLGKVLGVGLVGLTQLGIWAAAFVFLQKNQGKILGAFGVTGGDGAAASFLPTTDPRLLVVFLVFFVLGFLFYSTAYAAIGSMCNTVQEAQQLQSPIMVMTIAGWFSAFALLRDPTSSFAQIASLIPPLAPFVVPVRYSIAVIPLPELALYLVTMVIGLLLMVWITARVYRVGILMYGKRATFGDLFRWIRTT
ncbi:MAG: ABC transporter permease [Gemmatimonadales bacterium]